MEWELTREPESSTLRRYLRSAHRFGNDASDLADGLWCSTSHCSTTNISEPVPRVFRRVSAADDEISGYSSRRLIRDYLRQRARSLLCHFRRSESASTCPFLYPQSCPEKP